ERLLAAHDGERERRPLERVVVHADDERRRLMRRVRDLPHADGDEAEGDERRRDSQLAVDANPFSDCLRTRQPVAKTVRRYRRTERSAIHSRSCGTFYAIEVS